MAREKEVTSGYTDRKLSERDIREETFPRYNGLFLERVYPWKNISQNAKYPETDINVVGCGSSWTEVGSRKLVPLILIR
jgi:hypothetical protein